MLDVHMAHDFHYTFQVIEYNQRLSNVVPRIWCSQTFSSRSWHARFETGNRFVSQIADCASRKSRQIAGVLGTKLFEDLTQRFKGIMVVAREKPFVRQPADRAIAHRDRMDWLTACLLYT